MATRTNEAADEKLGQNEPVRISEVGDHPPIEQAVENDIRMEAFMNEELTITVHRGSAEGDPRVIVPVCNGTNMPIIRGVKTKVKRKYVEILARGRVTDYEQEVHNPMKPENIQMIPETTLVYPFAVHHDPNPKGKEWLDQILEQPV